MYYSQSVAEDAPPKSGYSAKPKEVCGRVDKVKCALQIRWVCLLSAFFSSSAAVLGQQVGPSVSIAPFAGNRSAAISYTFDDGLRDQYLVGLPMLKEVGFKGTFFVIPGCVATTVEEAEKKQDDRRAWGSLTWDELRSIAQQGHEIGSHTWSHRSLTKLPPEDVDAELSKSYEAIKKEIGIAPLTLAFPFNQHSPEVDANAAKYYVACRDYQLGAGGVKSTDDSLKKWTDQLVLDHKWGVMMAHGISHGYAAFTDPEIFRSHLKYVKSQEDAIWVDTFSKVARYLKEASNGKIKVISSSEKSLTFTVECSLDPALFNVPLTFVINAPGAMAAHAKRGGDKLPAKLFRGTILIEAKPTAEPIVVSWN